MTIIEPDQTTHPACDPDDRPLDGNVFALADLDEFRRRQFLGWLGHVAENFGGATFTQIDEAERRLRSS